MRAGRLLTWVLGLGMLLPAAAAAEEPVAAESLLTAYLRTLDSVFWTPAAVRETVPPSQENFPTLASSLAHKRWSAERSAARALTSAPAAVSVPARAPRYHLTVRAQGSRLALVSSLPRPMPPTMFLHGRVRGPFEQVFPRPW